MANRTGLLIICLFLASLHKFIQPVYCIDGISERGLVGTSNWEQDSTELKGSWFRKLKAVPPNSGNALVLTVAKEGGQGVFTTVQQAINAVPVNNKNPVVINVKPGIYKSVIS